MSSNFALVHAFQSFLTYYVPSSSSKENWIVKLPMISVPTFDPICSFQQVFKLGSVFDTLKYLESRLPPTNCHCLSRDEVVQLISYLFNLIVVVCRMMSCCYQGGSQLCFTSICRECYSLMKLFQMCLKFQHYELNYNQGGL